MADNPIDEQRAEAVARALSVDEIRAALERAGLSDNAVRQKVMVDLGELYGPGDLDEERLVVVDESLVAPERRRRRAWRRMLRLSAASLSGITTLVVAVLGVVGGVGAVVGKSSVGNGWIYVAGAILVGGALVGLVAQLASVASNEQEAREAISEMRTRMLHRLDAQAERQVRRTLNELAQTTFSRELRPLDTSGLGDLFDTSYDVSIAATHALADSLVSLRAGSLGIAGPRGAGKSTLMRRAVDGGLDWATEERPLGVEVPAPVRYDAREFVPHLFAKLCLKVLGPRLDSRRLERASKERRDAQIRILATVVVGIAGYLVFIGVVSLRTGILIGAGAVVASALPLIRERLRLVLPDDSLEGLARTNLDRLRFLETQSEEWSAELSSTAGKLASRREVSRAAQAWTMPELIAAYRDFVTRITENNALIVGIDELDKMASVDEAQRFLNEIKALFGQSRTYYLVTLSDDAMSAFESRGLPLRDVFESVFDDVLRVKPLSLEESAAVLHQRTVGVAPPFVGLCHAVSGGLPRELIRTARAAVRIAEDPSETDLSIVTRRLLVERTNARQLAAEVVARRYVAADGTQAVVSWLRGLPRNPTAAQLLDRTVVASVLLDLRALGGEAHQELELLVIELASAAYHAASTIEFFSEADSERYAAASSEAGEDSSAIEVLTRATRDLTVAPHVAWESTSEFRRRVGLPVLDYPLQAGASISVPE